MPRLLRMPAVATGSVEALLRDWAVSDGSTFSVNDVIATVETEKAAVDIEADADGKVLKALVPEGSAVEVGAPIAVLVDRDEVIGDIDAVLAKLGVSAPAVEGVAPAAATAEVTTPAAQAPAAQTPRPPAPEATSDGGGRPPEAAGPSGGATAVADRARYERLFISPLARRLARDAELSLDHLVGTGPGGRIVRRDVDAAIARAATVPAAATIEPAKSEYRDVPHPRIRKVIAARLTQSQATPTFYLRGSCRVDDLLAAREQLNAVSPVRISVNDMVIKAAARAQMLVPAMNSIWLDDVVRSYTSADISVAIATEAGVVAPILRGVERQPISELAASVRDFVERAKSGRLRQEELDGGALSVTNLGMYGTEEFAAIINPPQSAILAVGAARAEAIVEDDHVAVGTVMRVTLSVDHRVIDGAVAAEWMRAFVALVEHPMRIFV
jgi:pyruvate dehydrogenase E2 component (dihydrolipoamide acetyltransferase)